MYMNRWKGVAFTLVFAVPAYFLGQYFPIIGGPVFGILLGMVFASVRRPAVLEDGIAYTGKKVLQYSIILLGFEMNLYHVLDTGAKSVSIMTDTDLAPDLYAGDGLSRGHRRRPASSSGI